MKEANLRLKLFDTPNCCDFGIREGRTTCVFEPEHNLVALSSDQTSPMVSE